MNARSKVLLTGRPANDPVTTHTRPARGEKVSDAAVKEAQKSVDEMYRRGELGHFTISLPLWKTGVTASQPEELPCIFGLIRKKGAEATCCLGVRAPLWDLPTRGMYVSWVCLD
jgi:hypothetical protein